MPSPYDRQRPRRTVVVLEAVEELADETRFPDAGRPEQREQIGGPLGPRPFQAAPQEFELRSPPDHRGVEVAGMTRPRRLDTASRGKPRPGLAFPRVERLDRFHVDRVTDQPMVDAPNEDLARRRRLLETSRDVHRVAGHQALARRGSPATTSPVFTPTRMVSLSPCRARAPSFRAARASLHRLRTLARRAARRPRGAAGSEDGHDRVADELLDDARRAPRRRPQGVEVARLDAAQRLGVKALPDLGRTDHVGEDDRDDLAHLAGRGGRCVERRAAHLAEPGAIGLLSEHDGQIRTAPS